MLEVLEMTVFFVDPDESLLVLHTFATNAILTAHHSPIRVPLKICDGSCTLVDKGIEILGVIDHTDLKIFFRLDKMLENKVETGEVEIIDVNRVMIYLGNQCIAAPGAKRIVFAGKRMNSL